MSILEQQVQDKAKQLQAKYWSISNSDHSSAFPRWIEVSKHVLICELRARLDQTEKIYKMSEKSRPAARASGTHTIAVIQTVEDFVKINDDIRKQISELEGKT